MYDPIPTMFKIQGKKAYEWGRGYENLKNSKLMYLNSPLRNADRNNILILNLKLVLYVVELGQTYVQASGCIIAACDTISSKKLWLSLDSA